jgi:nucleoside-diphosphate-sugar epimerase
MKETMRIFVAGATGTIGMPVVRRLLGAGHEVIGLTRTNGGAAILEEAGAKAVIGDALDRTGLERIIQAARPTHVLHLLTALPKAGATRARDLVATNELRIRGTENLLRASIAAGVKRIVAESFVIAYGVGDLGGEPLPESRLGSGVHRDPAVQAIVDATRSLESQMAGAANAIETVVLRFGFIYGPGVPSTAAMFEALRHRRLPLIRGAAGVGSFVHIDDAADAVVAALEQGRSGAVYNIADDHPIGMTGFLVEAARALGAPPPRSVPRWLARLVAPLGAELVASRTPMSNARARRELLWTPRYPSLETGLRQVESR